MEHATLIAGGETFEVVHVKGREGVSELFRYEVTCAAGAAPMSPDELAGGDASLTLRDGAGGERTITAIVIEAEEIAGDDDHTTVRLVLGPRAHLLTLGRSCRVFQDKTVVDIVSDVLGKGGVAHRWAVTKTYEKHVYCAQYREDDWTFVARMLEEEGIYFYVDHEAGGALVLADDSRGAPDLPGGAAIAFGHELGGTRGVESIVEMGGAGQVTPSRFSVGSFNPDNPKLKVGGGVGAGTLEIYEAGGGGPRSPEACARRASFAAEASAGRASSAAGSAVSARIAPGYVMDVRGHDTRSGKLFVSSVAIEVVQRRRGPSGGEGGEAPFTCRFGATAAAAPHRPEQRTPPAKQAGLQLGVVVGESGAEVAPSSGASVRVQHFWDREGQRDEKAGKWMRVAQRATSGSMLLPRIGWTVATYNEEGEIDEPHVLSRLHDGEHPPAYALPANKTRVVYKTATTPGGGSFNEIRYEDKAGSEQMFWNASRNLQGIVQNDADHTVVRHAKRAVTNDEMADVGASLSEEIGGNRSSTVGRDESVNVGGDATKTVGTNETITIGKSRSITTGTTHTDTVVKKRSVSVGVAQIDVTLGTISAKAEKVTTLVGGAIVRATASSLADAAGWASAQTIGGAKIELIKKGRETKVKKRFLETVGGAMKLTSAASYSANAEENATWKVGGALSAKAPLVRLEAKTKIAIKVGSSSITITADEITLSSPGYDLTQSTSVVVDTPKVTNN